VLKMYSTTIQEQKMAKAHNIIAKGDRINKIDNVTYEVPSQSGNWFYRVSWDSGEWHCDCPDHNKREASCKHIYSTMLWIGLHDTSKEVDEHKPLNFSPCPKCGSYDAIRKGFKTTKKGRKQKFRCKDCGRNFMLKEGGFENMKFSPEIVCQCIDLYFKGVSLRKIAHHIGQTHKGLSISHVMIYYWIKRYTKIISDYVDDLNPKIGDLWHADEMMVKVKQDGIKYHGQGVCEWAWVWNCMDADTRFLLANQVTTRRGLKDVRRLFSKAKDVAKSRPEVLITDGLMTYPRAIRKEFGWRNNPHRIVGLRDKSGNNRVERLHGTIRQREKVMRAMHTPTTSDALMNGYRVHYNFVRPHMALGGLTPSEKANIDLDLGHNKWKGLIEKAIKNQVLHNS
jgi:transposase-like protein